MRPDVTNLFKSRKHEILTFPVSETCDRDSGGPDFDLHGIYVYRYGVGRFFKCHGLQLVHADCGIVRCVYVPFGKQ